MRLLYLPLLARKVHLKGARLPPALPIKISGYRGNLLYPFICISNLKLYQKKREYKPARKQIVEAGGRLSFSLSHKQNPPANNRPTSYYSLIQTLGYKKILLYLLLLYTKPQAIQNQEYKTARKQRVEAGGRLLLTSFRINPKTALNKKQRLKADFLN